MSSKLCPFCMRMAEGDTCPHCGKSTNYAGSPTHLPAGYVVSGKHPYVLGAALGQGGFGITYIALDMVTGDRVAIKEYFPTFCASRTEGTVSAYPNQEETFLKGRERFLDEARVLKSLSDLKCIVNVLDFFEFNNSAYLVMEFLEGSSLKGHVAKHGKFPAQKFLSQIRPLMEDIERMHQRGVVHRDIAPDNIMLLPDGQMKLIDFGTARSFIGDRSMTVVVKKGFAPLEQYLTKGTTPSTDVYALAATIYYCITGTVPMDSAERQYDNVPLQPPSALGADTTPLQEKALAKALEIQQKARTQGVQEFLDDLNKEPEKPKPEPAKPKHETPVTKPSSEEQKPLSWKKFLAAAAILAVVMLVGFFSARSGNETASPEMNAPVVPVEQIALKVWVPEEEMEITQEMCAAFDETHPEYEINFDISVVGIYESEGLLLDDPELAADVMQLPSGGISPMSDAGLLLPITANLEATQALYGKGAIAGVTSYSEEFGMDLMYGVPFSPNCFFMYYNKDLYTEDEVKSLDTMMAKDLGDDVYNFSYTLHDSWYLETYFYAAGCTLFGADGTDPTNMTWNDANGMKAAEYIVNLVNNPKYIEDRDGVASSLMKDGKLGALCSGVWSYGALYEVLGDKLGACALPTIELNSKTCQLSNFANYKCFAVKSNTAHPMAAQLLAEWLANEENQLIRYQNAGVAPCALALMDNEKIASNASTVALIAQTQFATPQPSIAQIANYWAPVAALGEGFEKGTITMDNAQTVLDKTVDLVLKG